eukprot:13499384-Ditylum_brightwellii.AAC.1
MLQQQYRANFIDAMYKEAKHMFDNSMWEKLPRCEMHVYYKDLRRQGIKVERQKLMFILSFNRKRHADGLLSKYKAGHCCHVGHQQWGMNFYEAYTPVMAWDSKKNLYGLKDAGRTWWEHFLVGLDKLGFRQHISDLCVWKKHGVG